MSERPPASVSDAELRAEVERRDMLVVVGANDPHDGYYVCEPDDRPGEGWLNGGTEPMAWRSDVGGWTLCSIEGCENRWAGRWTGEGEYACRAP